MPDNQFTPITPAELYNGLADHPSEDSRKLSDVVRENKPSGNNYIDLFASKVRLNGKRQATDYAQLLGADFRHFDGAIRCMTGMSAHSWINEYLRLVACDLVEHTNFNFKTIGKILGFSQSSFSQFFRAYQKMQAWEYRSLKRYGRKQRFFYD
jgi:AraC-like DNA-binding protein